MSDARDFPLPGQSLVEWRLTELEKWRAAVDAGAEARKRERPSMMLTTVMALTAVLNTTMTILVATGAIR